MKTVLPLIITLIILIGFLSGCITYEDENGVHLGFPHKHKSNIDEKPAIDISELEKKIHQLTNIEREKYGLQPLKYDYELSDIARSHSQDMAINNYFDHYNLEGQGPTDRAKSAGYNCYKDFGSYYVDGIGENIFQNNLYACITYYNNVPVYNWLSQDKIAKSTVDGWMTSYGHRENILKSSYDKEGIGISISSDYKVYVTQNFW